MGGVHEKNKKIIKAQLLEKKKYRRYSIAYAESKYGMTLRAEIVVPAEKQITFALSAIVICLGPQKI